MSKDNGTYILETKSEKINTSEYRVAHFHALENIFKDKSLIYGAFQGSGVYNNAKHAFEKAKEIDTQIQSEYGILLIEHFRDNLWREIELMAEMERPINV